ncbi:MAG: hypothetical protein PHP74_04200 [Candidatus Gracilibacteria bacterium]|nr:hypothetical protein [Candidatus Gracilibacteria bacterium]
MGDANKEAKRGWVDLEIEANSLKDSRVGAFVRQITEAEIPFKDPEINPLSGNVVVRIESTRAEIDFVLGCCKLNRVN